jgi:hypothetical protein
VPGDRSGGTSQGGVPTAPPAPNPLPLPPWLVPFVHVLVYAVDACAFFHREARGTDARLVGIVLVLPGIMLAYSLVWFVVGVLANLTVGVFVPLGMSVLPAGFPGVNRPIVIAAPRPSRGTWRRFGLLKVSGEPKGTTAEV